MRIGIDLSVVNQQMTGVPRYAFLLAKYLRKLATEHEFVFFDAPKTKIPFWTSHVSYARRIKKAKLDVFHGTANAVPWLMNGGKGRKGEKETKIVLTIHDLAIYKHPEWFPRGQWFATRFVVPRSIRRADKIIVPSEVTKKDLMEMFGVGEEKIAVVPLGVEERFFVERQRSALTPPSSPPHEGGKERGYILFIGGDDSRKNLKRVLEAYQGLPQEIREKYELYIVGQRSALTPPSSPPHEGGKEGGALAAEAHSGIRYLDYVPDDDMPALYHNAALLVYPSLYEGFGLPVLEAMAAGVPVVTSKDSAMAEMITSPQPSPMSEREPRARREAGEVSDLAMELVDPYSVDEIREGIVRVLESNFYTPSSSPPYEGGERVGVRDDAYLSEKVRQGIERAREYSWEKCAKRTLEVYESI